MPVVVDGGAAASVADTCATFYVSIVAVANEVPPPTMSLDKNLFTLLFTPNKDAPSVTDLVDPAGTIHYRKQRIPGSTYAVEVYGSSASSTWMHWCELQLRLRSHVRVPAGQG